MQYFWDTDNEIVYSGLREMTFKCHSRSSARSFFVRWPELSIRDRKGRLHFFQTRTSEITLRVDQGHSRWHNVIGHISRCIICINHASILYHFWDIQHRIMSRWIRDQSRTLKILLFDRSYAVWINSLISVPLLHQYILISLCFSLIISPHNLHSTSYIALW